MSLVRQPSKPPRPVQDKVPRRVEWRTINGRRVPIRSPKPEKSPQTQQLHEQSAGFERETELIRQSAKTPKAQRPHKFLAAEWTHPNGHPRCCICGCEETTSGHCPGLAKEPASFGPGAAGSRKE